MTSASRGRRSPGSSGSPSRAMVLRARPAPHRLAAFAVFADEGLDRSPPTEKRPWTSVELATRPTSVTYDLRSERAGVARGRN